MLGGRRGMAPRAPGLVANAWVQLIVMPEEISTREKLTVHALGVARFERGSCEWLRGEAGRLRRTRGA